MKLVIQRVKKAVVTRKNDGEIVGGIGRGLFVLLGIKKGDTKSEVNYLVQKLLKLQIMSDSKDLMNLSIVDTKTEILLVSQFTLYACLDGGNRPSFVEAELPEKAKELYEYFVQELNNAGVSLKTGSFGDYMEIDVNLDGPVTIVYEKNSN